jgi:hypothetical protein
VKGTLDLMRDAFEKPVLTIPLQDSAKPAATRRRKKATRKVVVRGRAGAATKQKSLRKPKRTR